MFGLQILAHSGYTRMYCIRHIASDINKEEKNAGHSVLEVKLAGKEHLSTEKRLNGPYCPTWLFDTNRKQASLTHSRKLRIQESEGKSDQGSRPLPLPLICNLVNSGFHRTTFKHLMKGKDLLALFCKGSEAVRFARSQNA